MAPILVIVPLSFSAAWTRRLSPERATPRR